VLPKLNRKLNIMKILRIRDVKMPEYGTPGSAGIDLFIPEDYPPTILDPNESVWIPSGIKVNVPAGHALVAMNKSGIAKNRELLVGACVIDEDYQGEIHIDLKNVGQGSQELNPGDKVIQLVCLPVTTVSIDEVESEDDLFEGVVTTRGKGGFGSTGTK